MATNGTKKISIRARIFSWRATLFGVLGTFVGVISLYLQLQEPIARLDYEIIADANVVNVHQTIDDLSVLFKGQDIQKTNQNLRIVTARVANSGDVNILPAMFDPQQHWGVLVEAGHVVSARIPAASSPYLQQTLAPMLTAESFVQLSKPILERGTWFDLEITLLHAQANEPKLFAIGKIAGLDEKVGFQRRLAQTSTSGGIWASSVFRAATFVLWAFLALAVVLVLAGSIWEKFGHKSQDEQQLWRRLVADTLRRTPNSTAWEALVNCYKVHGVEALETLKKALDDPHRLRSLVAINELEAWHNSLLRNSVRSHPLDPCELGAVPFCVVSDLIEGKHLGIEESGGASVSNDLRDTLDIVLKQIAIGESQLRTGLLRHRQPHADDVTEAAPPASDC